MAIMANYQAAFAANGALVEYPMFNFPVAQEMMGDQQTIKNGHLLKPTAPGIGVTLTGDIEARYPFDETAVYCCAQSEGSPPPDDYWQ